MCDDDWWHNKSVWRNTSKIQPFMLVGAENITYFVPKPAKAGDDIVIDVSQRYPRGTITLHLLPNHRARIVYSNGKDKVVDYKVGLLSISLEPLGQPRSLKRPRAIRQEQRRGQEGGAEAKTTMNTGNDVSTTVAVFESDSVQGQPRNKKKPSRLQELARRVFQQSHSRKLSTQVQQQAEIAAAVHHNKMLKRQHKSNQRLAQRIAKHNGTRIVLVTASASQPQYIPIPKYETVISSNDTFSSSLLLRRAREQVALEEVNAIRRKSKASRQESIKATQKRQQHADKKLQKRLALRQRANQARVLTKCKPFAKLSEEGQNEIVDQMSYEKIQDKTSLCEQGEAKTTVENSTVVVPGTPKVLSADVEQADVGQEKTIDHASLLNELRVNRQRTLQQASSVVASQRSQNLTKVAPMTKIVPAANAAKNVIFIRRFAVAARAAVAARTDRANLDDDDEEFHEIACEELTVDGVDYLLDLESKKVYAFESPNNFLGKYDGSNSKIDFDAVDSDDEDDEQ